MKTQFVPSKYQQAIYDFITGGTGNAVVSAVAGSGKTTTLLNAIKLIPESKSTLFLAFNKSIAKELAEKVPNTPNVTVKTVHGFGMSTLNKEFSGIQVLAGKYSILLRKIFEFHATGNIEITKAYDFVRESQMNMIDAMRFDEVEEKAIQNKLGYFKRVVDLCDLGRLNLIDMNNVDKGVDMLTEISKKHNIEIVNGECFRAWHLIKLGTHVINQVDYTDMIYFPIAYKLQTLQYDFVFVDECQDLNSCQRELMQRAIKPNGGRFVAVGDEKQAIYGFAGADADSFKKLCAIPKTIMLPLSVCYRCGTSIIAKAQTIVPSIEACDTAKEGVIAEDFPHLDIKSGDMVLCRNTFPLVSLCLKYLSMGIKSFVMGSDIGRSLVKMVEDTQRKTEQWTMENVFSRLYKEKEKIVASIMRKENLTQAEAEESSTVALYNDKIQVVELLSSGIIEPQLVIEKIKSIFSDDNNEGICLSTIHKSKGLEADRVFIIHAELMPSKFARKDWEKQQERNLMYVAYTRAKSTLGFVTDFNAWKDHESQAGNAKEVKESKFVGAIGGKSPLELEVITVKEITDTTWGTSTLFEMIDTEGNLFSKFGTIADRFIISNHDEVKEGTKVRFSATVKAHKEYRGVKTTVLSTLAKYSK
jgi:DNA helicase-2/ATP-dependent DNA helicase PcrA